MMAETQQGEKRAESRSEIKFGSVNVKWLEGMLFLSGVRQTAMLISHVLRTAALTLLSHSHFQKSTLIINTEYREC